MLTSKLKILPEDKNFKTKVKDSEPDMMSFYQQKLEDAIDSGDKEEMKRWSREIFKHVRFNDQKVDVRPIEKETLANDFFRKVVFTGKHLQVVLMKLEPGEEIGTEVHEDTDQFFRIEEGECLLVIKGQIDKVIKPGDSVNVEAGVQHNIINIGDGPLKLYTIYGPPQHPEGTVQETTNG